MVRSRRPLTWWRLPGVVASFQPIAAPDGLRARYNRTSNGTTYTVTPNAATPIWTPWGGWYFTFAEDWSTGVAAGNGYSMLVRAVPASSGRNTAGSTTFWIRHQAGYVEAVGSNYVGAAVSGTPSVLGIAGPRLHNAGVEILSTLNGTGISGTIYIGSDGSSTRFIGTIQAALIAKRTLQPAEVALASHQMAYCEFNPAWNAWAPERRYFYKAPPPPVTAEDRRAAAVAGGNFGAALAAAAQGGSFASRGAGAAIGASAAARLAGAPASGHDGDRRPAAPAGGHDG